MTFKRTVYTLLILLLLVPAVSGTVLDSAREAGLQYVKFDEIVMADGPFFIQDQPYYILDYMTLGELEGSLVYDPAKKTFVTDQEIMRKALAIKDLKSLTMWDPLFFSVGDSSKIPLAARFETQNVRNFAAFSTLTDEEMQLLEAFLQEYQELASSIAESSKITNSILYPNDRIKFSYSRASPGILIDVDQSQTQGRFSYEGLETLIKAYENTYSHYQDMASYLMKFGGGLEEYPPGARIREKWEVVMTKESILQEIYLVNQNRETMKTEIQLRKDILTYPYEKQIDEAEKRLGLEKRKSICGPTLILILVLLPLLVLSYFKKIPPRPSFFIPFLMITIILAGIAVPALSQDATFKVPTAEELMSQKVRNIDEVPIEILAEDIDEENARDLLRDFRLIMEGESVIVRGPYYYFDNPVYLFDIVKDGESTGKGFLIDATTLRLIGDQRIAFQLLKTRFLADIIERKPLYKDIDIQAIAREAENAAPPLNLFLANLTENIETGTKLEENLILRPDFKTLMNLTRIYVQGYITLQKIERATPSTEAMTATKGFLGKKAWLEAYARSMMGLSADEYLEGRRAQYYGRTLNRLPLMQKLSAMGMRPSKAQIVHDLTSDLIYDNIYLWRLGRIRDPNLFARLAFKEGTYTLPQIPNATSPTE